MAYSWKLWEGQIVDEKFPLHRFLGGSDHDAVFLTERPGPAKRHVSRSSSFQQSSSASNNNSRPGKNLHSCHIVTCSESSSMVSVNWTARACCMR